MEVDCDLCGVVPTCCHSCVPSVDGSESAVVCAEPPMSDSCESVIWATSVVSAVSSIVARSSAVSGVGTVVSSPVAGAEYGSVAMSVAVMAVSSGVGVGRSVSKWSTDLLELLPVVMAVEPECDCDLSWEMCRRVVLIVLAFGGLLRLRVPCFCVRVLLCVDGRLNLSLNLLRFGTCWFGRSVIRCGRRCLWLGLSLVVCGVASWDLWLVG